MSLSPLDRHWHHVEELRQLFQSMPAGAGRDRVEARWKATLAEHRQLVQDAESKRAQEA